MKIRRQRRITLPFLILPIFLAVAGAARGQDHWVGSWYTSQMAPDSKDELPADAFQGSTLRQVVHLTIGGEKLRVRFSNRFGTTPFHIASVHVALASTEGAGAIVKGTDAALRFSGSPDVTIPAGADYISDPLGFRAGPLSDLAISIYFDSAPSGQTSHPGSHATSYLVRGNKVSEAALTDPAKFEHWYFIEGVDVAAAAKALAVVTLGDSITDGHGSTTNENDRWPDVLAKKLQANPKTREISVLNEGIGGNRLLLDRLGPNALARFDHDVLAPPGVRYVIVLEGINDIGMLTRDADAPQSEHDALVHNLVGAYEQIIARAHAHGIEVVGATLTPFVGGQYYHPGAATEADREALNRWIREPGHFDGVVDFDSVTRDPQHPDRMLPSFDSGDHLHPGPAGYAAMGNSVPLSLFEKARAPAHRN